MATLIVGLSALLLFPLIFTAFLLGFIAVVVGIAALLRLRGRPDRAGRVMIGIGVAAGVLSIPLAILLVAADTGRQPYFAPTSLPYARLHVGDCFQRSSLDRGVVDTVWCWQEHDRQAIGVAEFPIEVTAAYPTAPVLSQFADDHCQEAFSRFIDRPD